MRIAIHIPDADAEERHDLNHRRACELMIALNRAAQRGSPADDVEAVRKHLMMAFEALKGSIDGTVSADELREVVRVMRKTADEIVARRALAPAREQG